MSMEMHVLFHGKLPSKAGLTRCFKELGFPLAFPRGSGALEQHEGGYLPMRLRSEESGVEFDLCDGREAIEEIAGKDVDRRFTRSANFRFGGDDGEFTVALCFAAALAKLKNGEIFDPQEGDLETIERTIDAARKQLATSKPASKARGTRPAAIKHYLKPLLQMRSDLLLTGRLLLIRPVRHLLRGVCFEPSGDEYCLKLRRYLVPMFDIGPPTPQMIRHNSFETWQPHFEPLLMDHLAEEHFTEIGSITTLLEYAEAARSVFPYMTALVLAGRADKACEWLEERDLISKWRGGSGVARDFSEHFEHVTKDIAATCAACRAKEAEWIKALKLEHAWEPTPFPVELPAAQRTTAIADPLFITNPWPARPEWLWQEVPQRPGEVRYAKNWLCRGKEVLLLVALTAAEAEERHREGETYVLAARLPDGLLLLVSPRSVYDRHDSEPSRDSVSYLIFLVSDSREVLACAKFDSSTRSVTMDDITVQERGGLATSGTPSLGWSWTYYRSDGQMRLKDGRGDDGTIHSKWPITPAELELRTIRDVRFGEYLMFAERLRSVLLSRGYGELS
jgi:hypothetical protein